VALVCLIIFTAPLCAKATAAARPIPRAAPVTTATLPLRIRPQGSVFACVICPSMFPANEATLNAADQAARKTGAIRSPSPTHAFHLVAKPLPLSFH
jgi:hypothetical protein